MKKVTINKMPLVENTDPEMLAEGVVAFQAVEFVIDYFGNEVVTTHDTKIMSDGRQLVIGGCGYIPDGYEVNDGTLAEQLEELSRKAEKAAAAADEPLAGRLEELARKVKKAAAALNP